MSQAGARGPASPPKPPPPVPAKGASPPAPPVAPKGAAPVKAPAAGAPAARVGKTTMLGVQAPKPAASPADDSWDVAPTRIEEKARPPAAPQVPTPVAPAVTPVAPAAAHVASPLAPAVVAPGPATAGPPGLTASDVRLIVRTLVEDAVLPLQRALVEAQQRIAELERRPSPAQLVAAPTVMVSVMPAPPVAAPVVAVAPRPHTGAISIPPRIAPTHYSMPPAPLLDVAAIERDIPLDINTPFDGSRRRRRLAIFVVIALLAIFGGLFALLANSYTPQH